MNKRVIWVIILFVSLFSVELLAQDVQESDQTNKTAVKKAKKLPLIKMAVSPSVVELLGVEATKFLANADQLQLFTIDFKRDSITTTLTPTHIVGYKILGKAEKISKTVLPTLQHIALNPASYFWDNYTKSCVFAPYIAVVFGSSKSKDKMVILCCFSCDEWEFHFKGKSLKEDSDLARRQLLHQFKAAFKDNKTLQSLN